jgi:hypothetical protein
MSKRTIDQVDSKVVYVLFSTHHVDCYKRPSSSCCINGVFDTEEKAISHALKSEEMIELIDNQDTEFDHKKNLLLYDYQRGKIPKTKEAKKSLFDLLCKLQCDKQQEFTNKASGTYFKIQTCTIE